MARALLTLVQNGHAASAVAVAVSLAGECRDAPPSDRAARLADALFAIDAPEGQLAVAVSLAEACLDEPVSEAVSSTG